MIGQMIILSGPEKGSYNVIVNDMIRVCANDSIGDIKNIPSTGSAFNFDQLVDPNTPVKMVFWKRNHLM